MREKSTLIAVRRRLKRGRNRVNLAGWRPISVRWRAIVSEWRPIGVGNLVIVAG
jgi:hypothetical protein